MSKNSANIKVSMHQNVKFISVYCKHFDTKWKTLNKHLLNYKGRLFWLPKRLKC